MGTNFYTLKKEHIGKRSAAGLYCWDCNTTLCMGGEKAIHNSDSFQWYKKCPKCGKSPVFETLEQSSAGRELGFNKTLPALKKGVASCSSFTWAVSQKDFCLKRIEFVKDEYGRKIPIKKFLNIVDLECPVQYTHLIGDEFS
jgi:hypothetical protein